MISAISGSVSSKDFCSISLCDSERAYAFSPPEAMVTVIDGLILRAEFANFIKYGEFSEGIDEFF
jgi:hypothetical protein